jgi:hypothetical protein
VALRRAGQNSRGRAAEIRELTMRLIHNTRCHEGRHGACTPRDFWDPNGMRNEPVLGPAFPHHHETP